MTEPLNNRGQRQDSLNDQMRSVLIRAREMGCYDAEDWIRRRFYAPDAVIREAFEAKLDELIAKETYDA